MDSVSTHTPTDPPTAAHALRPGEELVRVRAGAWRLLLPMRFVTRVHGAALPAARPSRDGEGLPVVAVGRDLVPVVFAEALLGAREVRLAAHQQMILLAEGERRAILWVDAVEEVLAHAPAAAPPGDTDGGGLVAGWSHPDRPLAVVDVPRLLELVA